MKKLSTGVFSILLLAINFSGCAGSNKQVVQSGKWGGEHISLIVTDSISTLDYDCAHGTIDEPIISDDKGLFEAIGVHVFESGGPIRLGEIPDKHPVLYNGGINGNKMTLMVTLIDTDVVIDTFFLSLGSEPNIYKCY